MNAADYFENAHFHFSFFFCSSVRQSRKSRARTTSRPNAIIEMSLTLHEPLKRSSRLRIVALQESRRSPSPIKLPRKKGGRTKILRTRARPAAVNSAVVERGNSEYRKMTTNAATPFLLMCLPRYSRSLALSRLSVFEPSHGIINEEK